MAAIEQGRVCMKTTGKDAGSRVVILKVEDKNSVVVEGPETKRGKCNASHLTPLNEVLEVNSKTQREEIVKMLKVNE